MKLSDVAAHLKCRLEGDGTIDVQHLVGIEQAGPGDLTFFVNPRYTNALRATRASAVILGDDAPAAPCAMLRSDQPYVTFAEALELFTAEARPEPGIHPSSVIAASAQIGIDVAIGPFVVVEEGARVGARTSIAANSHIGHQTQIGADCVIHSHVAIRERSRIGDRVVIHNGAIIASDGFGFAKLGGGSHRKIRQAGTVVIEDDVEIGANSVVDRPALGETRIGAGTKIDNLVQIAHGVSIGRNVLLAAQVGIAGSTRIEDDAVLAGQVGVAGHLTIGKGAAATAQSGIPNSIKPGAFVSGYPAIDNRDWLKASAVFRKLPELRKTISDLERRVAELEELLRDVPVAGVGSGRQKS